jgi:hypothetical protein
MIALASTWNENKIQQMVIDLKCVTYLFFLIQKESGTIRILNEIKW